MEVLFTMYRGLLSNSLLNMSFSHFDLETSDSEWPSILHVSRGISQSLWRWIFAMLGSNIVSFSRIKHYLLHSKRDYHNQFYCHFAIIKELIYGKKRTLHFLCFSCNFLKSASYNASKCYLCMVLGHLIHGQISPLQLNFLPYSFAFNQVRALGGT